MLLRESSDYRAFLKNELATRMKENSRYSLRAFARSIQISPQALSLVLNGKRGLSLSMAAKISSALGLSKTDQMFFNDLVVYTQAKSLKVKKLLASRLSTLGESEDTKVTRLLKEDTFKVISEWYHYALIELTYVQGFRNHPKWIAHQLGIAEYDAQVAIDRLLRLNLLKMNKRGQLVKTTHTLTTPQDVASSTIRSFHKKMLEKAKSSLDLDPISERDFTTTTMAIDLKKNSHGQEVNSGFSQKFDFAVRKWISKFRLLFKRRAFSN
jgi:uncharacterized protein (TIGR02147 family)